MRSPDKRILLGDSRATCVLLNLFIAPTKYVCVFLRRGYLSSSAAVCVHIMGGRQSDIRPAYLLPARLFSHTPMSAQSHVLRDHTCWA